jgi:outer membrane lipoprotein SlyB
MATLALSVVGQFAGGMIGGPIGATIGRALGAVAGSAIDAALFGRIERGRRDYASLWLGALGR